MEAFRGKIFVIESFAVFGNFYIVRYKDYPPGGGPPVQRVMVKELP